MAYIYLTQRDIPGFPLWIEQLYEYELDKMYPPYKYRDKEKSKITLSGTINPNPNRFIMRIL